MLIKNFQAPTIPDALDLVRREFGTDAVILKTDVIRDNGTRLFSVTAAKEASAAAPAARPLRTPSPVTPSAPAAPNPGTARLGDPGLESAMLDVVLPELLKGQVRDYYLALRLHDVEANLALDICRLLQRSEQISDESLIRIISAFMPTAIELPDEAANLVFIGPCGSGKSSLLAKYATHFVFNRKERVTLETLDNFRPGADEEISNLADILELAVEPRQSSAGKQSRHLIDTTGLVNGDQDSLDSLTRQLAEVPQRFTIAVLSLTTGWRHMRHFLDFVRPLGVDAVAFTQLDAAAGCGALLNLVVGEYPPLLCISDSRLPTALVTQFNVENFFAKLTGGLND